MKVRAVPPRLLRTEALSSGRRKELSSEKFWALMDRWNVPTERALKLIGHNAGEPGRSRRPRFSLSEQQAKLMSCLLEIDLTLAVAPARQDCLQRWKPPPWMGGDSVLDAMGECDPGGAARVLWFLSQPRGVPWSGRSTNPSETRD